MSHWILDQILEDVEENLLQNEKVVGMDDKYYHLKNFLIERSER